MESPKDLLMECSLVIKTKNKIRIRLLFICKSIYEKKTLLLLLLLLLLLYNI